MDKLVIFESLWVCAILAAVLILHTLCALLRKFLGAGEKTGMIVNVIAIVNIILHAGLIVLMLTLGASPEEMFFVMCLSSAVALTASGAGKEAK